MAGLLRGPDVAKKEKQLPMPANTEKHRTATLGQTRVSCDKANTGKEHCSSHVVPNENFHFNLFYTLRFKPAIHIQHLYTSVQPRRYYGGIRQLVQHLLQAARQVQLPPQEQHTSLHC